MISFFDATLTAVQVYGIAIVISILVAVLIKVLVLLTSRLEQTRQAKEGIPAPTISPAAGTQPQGVPDAVVAAITAAISAVTSSGRILHIAESNRTWILEGRSALHSHQPKR